MKFKAYKVNSISDLLENRKEKKHKQPLTGNHFLQEAEQ